jgi:hypothetical protein
MADVGTECWRMAYKTGSIVSSAGVFALVSLSNAHSDTVPIRKSSLTSLYEKKIQFGDDLKTYLISCAVEGQRPQSGYHGGCKNVSNFEHYVNNNHERINLFTAIEFSPYALSVVFTNESYEILHEFDDRDITNVQQGCIFFWRYTIAVEKGTFLQITDDVDTVESCLFGGLLSFLDVDTRWTSDPFTLAQRRFVYNFIASPHDSIEEASKYAIGMMKSDEFEIDIQE